MALRLVAGVRGAVLASACRSHTAVRHATVFKFTKSHEWISFDEKDTSSVTMGITDYAQAALGDIVFVDMPAVGGAVEAKQELGAIESVKAASDLYSPIDGNITQVNEKLSDTPGLVNESPQEKGWIVKIKASNPAQIDGLLSDSAYHAFLKEQPEGH